MVKTKPETWFPSVVLRSICHAWYIYSSVLLRDRYVDNIIYIIIYPQQQKQYRHAGAAFYLLYWRERGLRWLAAERAVSFLSSLLPPPMHFFFFSLRRCHRYARNSASQSGLRRDASSPFTRLAELLTALRAWCKQCLPGRSKPDVLRPGIVGMRGSIVIRLRPCMIMSTLPHHPFRRVKAGCRRCKL